MMGVSAQTITDWENKGGALKLQSAKLASLRALARKES
ncbi:MAG: hypothetical protein JHD23_12125 [Akkermansiaceae bacterium]|nr:hypothetical protein [Akkermansiaceae bacterium]MBJ7396450.1 hypothetical protein [Akkermansiaceae bacterium]MBJ7425224.1 hypothetical protein [Akkermansiaceae bacterium]